MIHSRCSSARRCGCSFGQVAGLAVVPAGAVVELPHVVVERRQIATDQDPWRLVLGDGAPTLVVDAAVAEHLEVLEVVALGRVRVVERIEHARAFDGRLQHAVDHRGLGQPSGLEDGGGDVDHVGELRAQPAGLGDAAGPVHDRAVAGAAPVRGHLLGPLERRVHRPRPTDREVVVGAGRAELVQLADHELRRLDGGHTVEVGHLVEGAVHGALGRRTVVTDDVVDDRVVEDFEVLEGVDDAAHLDVGVLEEPGVHLHLPLEDGLELVGHVVPGGDRVVAGGQLGVRGDHAELFLLGEGELTLRVPAVGELAAVLLDPLGRDVVGGVGGAWRVVDEERLVRHERLLLAHPAHAVVGEVVGEVIALLGRGGRLDRRGALVEGRVPLVVLATDEAVEVLEPPALRRPRVERPHRRGLPHGHLVALAELRRRVAVQRQRQGKWRHRVRPHRTLPRRRRGRLGDAPHAGGVVVPAGQQRLPRRRAQRGRVEAVVPQAPRGEPLGRRRVARPAERASRTETDVVKEDHYDVGRALRRPKRLDRREGGLGVLGVVRGQPWWTDIRDRQDRAGMSVGCVGHQCLRSTQPAMLTSSSRCGVRGIARLGDPMRCHGRASTPGGTSRCARRAPAVRNSRADAVDATGAFPPARSPGRN